MQTGPADVKRDHYDILGVPRDSDQVEIRRAFRRLAMTCHPDVKPGDSACEARCKEAAEAYEVLRDPRKRAAYDH